MAPSLRNIFTLGMVVAVFEGCNTLITESGILAQRDVAQMRRHDVNAFLVGEAFMRAPDPGRALAALFD